MLVFKVAFMYAFYWQDNYLVFGFSYKSGVNIFSLGAEFQQEKWLRAERESRTDLQVFRIFTDLNQAL